MWPTLALLLLSYFVYHLVQGDRGVLAYLALERRVAEARVAVAASDEAREAIERKVAGLQPDTLDLDLLAELAHRLLNFGAPDELIVLEGASRRAGEPRPLPSDRRNR